MPVGLEHYIIHIADKGGKALVSILFWLLDNSLFFFNVLANLSPVGLLVFEPFGKVFLRVWAIINILILVHHRRRLYRLLLDPSSGNLKCFNPDSRTVFYVSHRTHNPGLFLLSDLEEETHILLLELLILGLDPLV